MKVYSVAEVNIVGDMAIFGGTTQSPIVITDDVDHATNTAMDYARARPGSTFWLIEGTATKAFRVEPAPVSVVDMAAA